MSENRNTSSVFAKFFWGAIIALAIGTVLLVAVGLWRSTQTSGPPVAESRSADVQEVPQELDIGTSTLLDYFRRAAGTAVTITAGEVDALLDELYSPVYAGIVAYADFHYTVLGQYTELVGAALGTATDAIEQKLFDGFTERLEMVSQRIDSRFSEEFERALMDEMRSDIPSHLHDVPLTPLAQRAIDDALSRANVTVPVATVMATVGGAAALKTVSAAIAAKMAAKVATKAAIVGAAKGGGLMGGIGAGALMGSWGGPLGAAAGGVIGGAVTCFAVDAAVINIDEYFRRADFEADLRQTVDEHRAVVRQKMMQAIEGKADDLESFTLRALGEN